MKKALYLLPLLWACETDDGAGNAPPPDAGMTDQAILQDLQIQDVSVEPDIAPDLSPDEEGPNLRFERPGHHERVGGLFQVELKADDPSGVVELRLEIDGEEVKLFEAEPYLWEWDTRALPEGPYRLEAWALDGQGNESRAEVVAEVRNPCGENEEGEEDCPPRGMRFVSPEDSATLCGPIQLTVEASDDHEVARVEIHLNEELVAEFEEEPYELEWDTEAIEDGPYQLRLTVEDSAGQRAFKIIEVLIENHGEDPCDNPPILEFLSPEHGEFVSGIVEVRVSATDDHEMKSVVFFVDGQQISEDGTAPYTFAFYTAELEAGEHMITARASDRNERVTTKRLLLIVDQVDPSLRLIHPTPGEIYEDEVRFEALADDDNGVRRVEFRIMRGEEQLERVFPEDPNAPEDPENPETPEDPEERGKSESLWVHSIPMGELPNEELTLIALVTDLSGREIALEPVLFRADPLPSLSFEEIAEGDVITGPVSVRINAIDDLGFERTQLFLDGELLGDFEEGRFEWIPEYQRGQHLLRAEASTLSQQLIAQEVQIEVNHPLEVSLLRCGQLIGEGEEQVEGCLPAETAEWMDAVSYVAETRDDDGQTLQVDFYLGETHLLTDEEAPFELSLNSWDFVDGEYELRAVALSDNESSASMRVAVEVNNCDRDHDGFGDDSRVCGGSDCNDADELIRPGAEESCYDGTDTNCDGWINEGCGEPPILDSASFHVNSDLGTLAFLVEGSDPEYDADRISVQLRNNQGQAIPFWDEEGSIFLMLDSFETQEEDGHFVALWSGKGPLEAASASVTVWDASGESSEMLIPSSLPPNTSAEGEFCDPRGAFSQCDGLLNCVEYHCLSSAPSLSCPEEWNLREVEQIEEFHWIAGGDTLDAGNQTRGLCGGGEAEDMVFHFTAPVSAPYFFSLEPSEEEGEQEGEGFPVLYARFACAIEDLRAEFACGPGLEFFMNAEDEIYLFVDAVGDWSGIFNLQIMANQAPEP